MKLSDYLLMKRHIKNLQMISNNADNEEIVKYRTLQEQKQEIEFIEFVRELERTSKELNEIKAIFNREQKEYLKKLEHNTKIELEKAITNGLTKSFK